MYTRYRKDHHTIWREFITTSTEDRQLNANDFHFISSEKDLETRIWSWEAAWQSFHPGD